MLHSGGRDSCVLQHILEPYLDETLIVWVNTGAAYESTLKQMRQVANSVPHFFEITTDQAADINKWGYPTDLLVSRHDYSTHGHLEPRLQSTNACCAKNIWYPVQLALKDKGITQCYIGSREDEAMYDNRWDGLRQGIDWKFPLRKWTKQMVLDYVKRHNIMVPPYYSSEEKSRDCWNCTGYLWERQKQIDNLNEEQKKVLHERLESIQQALDPGLEDIRYATLNTGKYEA